MQKQKKFKIPILLVSILITVFSCTLDKTDYEGEIAQNIEEHLKFNEVIVINKDHFRISIEALNGTFYKGYNEIRLKILDTQSKEIISNTNVSFLPILTNSEGEHFSCPHLNSLTYNSEGKYYSGYVVFTEESGQVNWDLYIDFIYNNQTYSSQKTILVYKQNNSNLNMTAFMGNDGVQYYIALIFPQKPKIAENVLVAGIYKYNIPSNLPGIFPDPTQYSYSQVEGFTLALDPRMPEPSMGNHSSPNNQDLIQRGDGLYQGVVNYTMTGNWTLNFIMYNHNGLIIKGTKVPTNFTPGVEGVKSTLYIDILF